MIRETIALDARWITQHPAAGSNPAAGVGFDPAAPRNRPIAAVTMEVSLAFRLYSRSFRLHWKW
jgi:hypothetical protein